jgi:hypothetical protein
MLGVVVLNVFILVTIPQSLMGKQMKVSVNRFPGRDDKGRHHALSRENFNGKSPNIRSRQLGSKTPHRMTID